MKKTYETPMADKVEFCYKDQVVASGDKCVSVWINVGKEHCESGNPTLWEQKM